MPYTPLTSNELGADKVVTAPTMQALYDNPNAIAAGEAGAPRIQEAAYAPGSVDRAALKTATATMSGLIDAGEHVNINLAQPYAFAPSIATSASAAIEIRARTSSVADADSPRFALFNPTGVNDVSYSIAYRYVAD